jgi:putative ABC transport system ATP-binding protein
VAKLTDRQLSALRAFRIGFVFQQFHLAAGVSARDNVSDGLLYSGVPLGERRERAEAALERVGLGNRMDHLPNELSGGERQRVAIARAVIGDPALLLADEPTGNLDSVAGAGVMEQLRELHTGGTTVLIITHDRELAAELPRQVVMRDGRVET